MDTTDNVIIFIMIAVAIAAAGFVGFQYGKEDQREHFCKVKYHGEPAENGSICIIADNHGVIRL